jgi:CDP-glycerol glycerophosphotransferase (TagB/SpsB family)
MTYTQAADLYLGDVSSQVYEFLYRPRPCVFLNPGHVAWQQDANYLFWDCGPVVEKIAELDAALAHAFSAHGDYLSAQSARFLYTFGAPRNDAATRATTAIVDYLNVA